MDATYVFQVCPLRPGSQPRDNVAVSMQGRRSRRTHHHWQMYGIDLPEPERSEHREMSDAEIARWDAQVDT
jgi:hypothetical protein